MWSVNYNLKNLIHYKSGYEYISSFKIYIPIIELGLNVLIRKEQQIPFFHEIILKLINSGIYEVYDISDISGVDLDILNDVIGDMSVSELIYVKSSSLMLTPKGRRTLETLKNISIEKGNINNIYVDCITGSMYEDVEVKKNIPKYCPWLEKSINIDDNFISKKFNDINKIFEARQEEFNQGFIDINSTKEIYQILNREYEKMYYLEKKIDFFRNDLDGSYLFGFENPTDEKEYTKELVKQVNSKYGAKLFLVKKNKLKKDIKIDFDINNELDKNLGELINYLLKSDRKDTDMFNELYFKNRYMISNEVRSILMHLKDIKPTKIMIKSNNLQKYLDSNIINFLKTLSVQTFINIIADKSEENIENLRKKLTTIGKENRTNKNIQWSYEDNINEDSILLYPYALIKSYSIGIPYNDDDYIIKEVAEIYFDKYNVEKNKN